MPRPGCVWTHTLLVARRTLARLAYPGGLDGLLQRPAGPDFDAAPYEAHVRLTSDAVSQAHEVDPEVVRGPDVRSLIDAVYSQSEPVVVVTPTPEVWSAVVLALWAQQWGGLRAAFSFCTGPYPALSDGRLLDVSVTMKEPRATGGARIVTVGDRREGTESRDADPVREAYGLEWRGATVDDLYGGDANSELRRGLRYFGADVPSERAAFPLVAALVSEPADLRGLNETRASAAALAATFPTPSTASRLKHDVLGPWVPAEHRLEHAAAPPDADPREVARLEVLLTTSNPSAFDRDALMVSPRLEAVARDPESRRDLALRLVRSQRNEWGEAAMLTLVASLRAHEIGELFGWDHELLINAVRRSPSIVAEPSLWSAPASTQRAVLDYLAEEVQSSDLWVELVGAALEADSDIVAQYAWDVLGPRAARAALDWLSASRRHRLPPDWARFVARDPAVVHEWIRATGATPIVSTCYVVSALSPSDPRVLGLDPDPWVTVAERARKGVETRSNDRVVPQASAYITALTVLLGIGLRSPEGLQLVTASYPAVSSLARKGQLTWSTWRPLERLARPPDWVVWDRPSKTEQLARATAEAFVHYRWPPSHFVHLVGEGHLLQQALKHVAKQSKRGRRFAEDASDIVG